MKCIANRACFVLHTVHNRELFGGDWPLDADVVRRIEKNFSELKELLDINKDFVLEMRKKECFSTGQLNCIETSTDDDKNLVCHDERNENLLKLLIRSSDVKFQRFSTCLWICQPHLVPYLNGNESKFFL